MRKNIFITGATGFVGSYVVVELLRRAHSFRHQGQHKFL